MFTTLKAVDRAISDDGFKNVDLSCQISGCLVSRHLSNLLYSSDICHFEYIFKSEKIDYLSATPTKNLISIHSFTKPL